MGDSGRFDNERPVHRVSVGAFEMALTPVTNRAYRLYLEASAAPPPPWFDDPDFNHPEQPVVGANWYEARAFCRWLGRESGLLLRLPTEAEREKAARGGLENRRFPWGDAVEGGGHRRLRGPLERPERVAGGPPNGYGLYNLNDTVHEWCLDAYQPDFYAVSPECDPCAQDGSRRSARGGSWRHQVVVTPSSARSSLPPAFRYQDFGFRWVRVLG